MFKSIEITFADNQKRYAVCFDRKNGDPLAVDVFMERAGQVIPREVWRRGNGIPNSRTILIIQQARDEFEEREETEKMMPTAMAHQSKIIGNVAMLDQIKTVVQFARDASADYAKTKEWTRTSTTSCQTIRVPVAMLNRIAELGEMAGLAKAKKPRKVKA
jgi:hypothetical protein